MKYWLLNIFAALVPALLLSGCASDVDSEPADVSYSRLTLTVSLLGNEQKDAAPTRGDFDNFDNELDKWGVDGENIEELRVIILDSDNTVEVNRFYPELANAEHAGKYEYRVRNNDNKTVILLANEQAYSIVTPEGETMSATRYFESFDVNTTLSVEDLKTITLDFADNAETVGQDAMSLKKPLPISAVHTQYIATTAENEVVDCDYVMHRAAVKYSFRVINKSKYDHKLEGIRISRVADREFLFPNAEYGTNDLGHQVIKRYYTPAGTQETEYSYSGFSLDLPKRMTEAVRAIEPLYVPEGLATDVPHKVSITLNSAPLAIWGELKWRMPGQDALMSTPMTDLPRNTHVVVNIIINDDNTFNFIADVQPYSSVDLDPFFGLERDKEGNVIVKRYPDGTYDVVDNGEIVKKDIDGDIVLKTFSDGSLYCCEKVFKDYIHDVNEVDYIYYFEKDYNGGNMIILREKSTGGTYHGDSLPEHDHDFTDRALFVLDKKGDFEYITYGEDGSPTYQTTDRFGDKIIQVNGYQFRNQGDMHKYIGSYVVLKSDGTEELRYYKDGSVLDWNIGVPETYGTRSGGSYSRSGKSDISPARKKEILRRMRLAGRNPFVKGI